MASWEPVSSVDFFTQVSLLPGYVAQPTARQAELIATFRQLVEKYGILLHVNEPLPEGIQEPVAVDVEHDEWGAFVCCGFFLPSSNSYYGYANIDALRLLPLRSLSFIGHNGIGDLDSLKEWGCDVDDSQLESDTMLIGHIIDSSLKTYGLKDMAARSAHIECPSYEDIVGKHKGKTKKSPKCPRTERGCCGRITLDRQPLELVLLYNCMDVYMTAQIHKTQTVTPQIQTYFTEVEQPASRVFEAMSTRGTRVDLDYLKGLKETLEAQQRPIKEAIFNELGPINLNSTKQLLEALNGKEIYPTLKNKPSTDKRALERYKELPVVSALLQYSELDTLLSNFVLSYLDRGTEIVHPFFNQCGTRTGRLSCSNPNLLQIPKRTENGRLVRKMFIPRDGMQFGDVDFAAIEPRILAHLSGDPDLCRVFNEGQNFHKFTQQRMGFSDDEYGYARAKVLNLSVGYRATFKSVGQQLGVSDNEAQTEINKWWALFPVLRRWQDRLIYDSKRSGSCTTLLGRQLRIDDLDHGNSWKRGGAERQLINNIAQASAREVMVMGMLKIHNDKRLSPNFGLLVQVYDELLAESSNMQEDVKIMVEDMETAVKLKVPLVVEAKLGLNWGELCTIG